MKKVMKKGSMCIACKKYKDKCSDLDFESMKVMKVSTNVIIVKCDSFESKGGEK